MTMCKGTKDIITLQATLLKWTCFGFVITCRVEKNGTWLISEHLSTLWTEENCFAIACSQCEYASWTNLSAWHLHSWLEFSCFCLCTDAVFLVLSFVSLQTNKKKKTQKIGRFVKILLKNQI